MLRRDEKLISFIAIIGKLPVHFRRSNQMYDFRNFKIYLGTALLRLCQDREKNIKELIGIRSYAVNMGVARK
jgi:hypothetical protein